MDFGSNDSPCAKGACGAKQSSGGTQQRTAAAMYYSGGMVSEGPGGATPTHDNVTEGGRNIMQHIQQTQNNQALNFEFIRGQREAANAAFQQRYSNPTNIEADGQVLAGLQNGAIQQQNWRQAAMASIQGARLQQLTGTIEGFGKFAINTRTGQVIGDDGKNRTQDFIAFVRGPGASNPHAQLEGLTFDGGEVGGYRTRTSELLKYTPQAGPEGGIMIEQSGPVGSGAGSTGSPTPLRPSTAGPIKPGEPAAAEKPNPIASPPPLPRLPDPKAASLQPAGQPVVVEPRKIELAEARDLVLKNPDGFGARQGQIWSADGKTHLASVVADPSKPGNWILINPQGQSITAPGSVGLKSNVQLHLILGKALKQEHIRYHWQENNT
ncbi:MAG: hypothetical protein WCI77_05695 [Candidatus Omnitrophota bacterium]